MKTTLLALSMAAAAVSPAMADSGREYSRVFTPFEKTVFYDGYNGTVFDKDVQDGILRHANYLYAKKLTDEALNWFGSRMDIDVTITA